MIGKLLIILAIYLLVSLPGDFYLKRKFEINRKESPLSEHAKKIRKRLTFLIGISYFIAIIVVIFKYEELNIFLIIVPYILVISLIQGGIERKYNREAKVWILEYSQGIYLVALFMIALLLL